VNVQNNFGCFSDTSNKITVTVNPIPSAPIISPSGTFSVCDSVTLSASTSDGYLWSNGATTSSIFVNQLGLSTFSVRAISLGCTSAVSAPVSVTIHPTPATPIVVPSGSTTFCAGDSISLSTATPSSAYLWSTGDTSQAIFVKQSGSYSVQVISLGCTSAVSAPLSVTVNLIPPAPSISAGGATTFCDGDSILLTSSVTAGYLWSTGATSQAIFVKQSGSYTVRAIVLGCTSAVSDPTPITVNPTPASPTITPNADSITVCDGTTLTANAVGAVQYVWSSTTGASGSLATLSVNQTGTYYVQQIDSGGCISPIQDSIHVTVNITPAIPTISPSPSIFACDSTNLTATGASGVSYLWNNGLTTSLIKVINTGSYTVRAIALGCTSATSAPTFAQINTTPPKPFITASDTTTFCDGDSVVLTSSNSQGYLWTPNVGNTQAVTITQSGTYSVRVVAEGCTSVVSEPVIVTVHPIPVVPTLTASGVTEFCDGDSVTLTSSTNQGNVWNTGSTNNAITVTVSGSYAVRATALGCTSALSTPIAVTVNPIPAVPIISAIGSREFCEGDSVTLNSNMGFQTVWSNNATTGSITVGQNVNFTQEIMTFTYTAVAQALGCTSAVSLPTTVTVYQNPTATIEVPDEIWYKDGRYNLVASADLPVSYAWVAAPFANGSTTNSELFVVPTTAGENFEYVVEVTTNFGCKATASVFKDVIFRNLRIPTGFSPNGDGVNDTWEMDGIDKYPDAVIQVFNRWGGLVFESTGEAYYRNYWDGSNLAQGSYFFVIDLKDGNKQKGTLTIVR
jgi:gliding motility-associated-like protein